MTYICNHCQQNTEELVESIQRAKNGAFQIRGECPFCRGWVKFVPYRDSYIVKQLVFAAWEGKSPENILKHTAVIDYTTKEIY